MQIRIIAGTLGGRRLKVPLKFSAQPMGERVRAAIFNSIGNMISGADFLDAFGGSGACGLEALSRGAGSVTIVEKDRQVFRLLGENVKELKLSEDSGSGLKLINGPIFSVLEGSEDLSFDIVLVDPPYNLVREKGARGGRAFGASLDLIASRLQKGGTLILSWPAEEALPEVGGLKLRKESVYAGAKVGWYGGAG